ncbi:hypothetical protein Pcinc_034875 [Petrolisthes cinctipes]|uniref:Phosphomevalonate kinase n=1 Tax=Petrolisthes cinctipes TaxID=88211 RepID=A0AAE1BXN3_PETCI|nr:hypothetical protein Pcinc_034875 [Petrolisthes cinctipes]
MKETNEACKLCKETEACLENHTSGSVRGRGHGCGRTYSNMANQQPKLIILFSGKRKTGKDYLTDRLYERLDKLNEKKSVIIRLSAPLKEEFATQLNLDYERLLLSNNYKEDYRQEMISFGEMKRKEDPGFFIRAAIKMFNAVDYPIWIVSDMRRKSDLGWFREHYPNQLYTVRIEATEEVRKLRGYIFTKGVDDVESECNLDDFTNWDMVIHNNGANLRHSRKEIAKMQIKGSGCVGGDGVVLEDERDSLTPFLTPQHQLASTPPHSSFLLTSQDSLDVYHDACSTLQRPHPTRTPTLPPPPASHRKRHASVGGNSPMGGAGAAGKVLELYPVLPASLNGLADAGKCNGESHHNGTDTPPTISHHQHQQQQHHAPYHIGRLSLSTNSLKNKRSDNDREDKHKTEPSIVQPTAPPLTPLLPRFSVGGNSSAWVLNYSPCVEMGRLFEEERTVPSTTTTQQQQLKYEPTQQQQQQQLKYDPNQQQHKYDAKISISNNNDAWRKNYVACVEAGVVGGGEAAMTTPMCPSTPGNSNLPPPPDSVIHMYTFGPP